MNTKLLKIRHERSQRDYPHLSLAEGEYVELEFSRATICRVLIWIAVIFAAVLLAVALIIFNATVGTGVFIPTVSAESARGFTNLMGLVLFIVIGLAGVIANKIFDGNRLYVTNKRAIQYEMISLFGNSVNIIELARIEDVSFRQNGIFQHLFGIGTIRMSTVGDETTYTFKYVYKPSAKEMRTLTDLVASAKKA